MMASVRRLQRPCASERSCGPGSAIPTACQGSQTAGLGRGKVAQGTGAGRGKGVGSVRVGQGRKLGIADSEQPLQVLGTINPYVARRITAIEGKAGADDQNVGFAPGERLTPEERERRMREIFGLRL